MEKRHVICDYCPRFTKVDVGNYRSHLSRIHKMHLPESVDLNAKFQVDNSLIKQYHENRELSTMQFLERQRIYLRNEKQLAQQRQTDTYVAEHSQKLSFIWDDLIFLKDRIMFDIKRLNIILKPVRCPGSFESLNLIKKEYFERIYPGRILKLCFLDGEILIDKSPGWKQIIDTIELGKDFYEFKYLSLKTKTRTKTFDDLSNNQIVSLFEKSFHKSEYLKLLASNQPENYKIIPVLEFINDHTEESFLFRLLTRKQTTIIVWENVNEARATHVFACAKNNPRGTLNLVQQFITREDFNSKRSILYGSSIVSKKLKADLNYLAFIRHTSILEFKREIQNLLLMF